MFSSSNYVIFANRMLSLGSLFNQCLNFICMHVFITYSNVYFLYICKCDFKNKKTQSGKICFNC